MHIVFTSVVFLLLIELTKSYSYVTTKEFESSNSCYTFRQYLQSAFYLNVGQQRRGASDNFLSIFYRNSIEQMMKIIDEKHPKPVTIGEACLFESDFLAPDYSNTLLGLSTELSTSALSDNVFNDVTGSLEDFYSYNMDLLNWTIPSGIEKADQYSTSFYDSSYQMMGISAAVYGLMILQSDEQFKGCVFYLPRTYFEDNKISDILDQSKIQTVWDGVENNLQQAPNMKLVDDLAKLPKTVDIFFESNEITVEGNFSQAMSVGKSISGFDLLFEVTSMVLSLHLAGVPDDDSLVLLKHATKFLFMGIRYQRVEGENLNVTNIFIPFYKRKYLTLLKKALYSAPTVTKDSVATLYKEDLAPLLEFSSHGQLSYDAFNTKGHIYQFDFKLKLFDREKLYVLMSQNTDDYWWWWYSGIFFFKSISLRQTNQCDDEFDFFEIVSVTAVNADLMNCCALICGDSQRIASVGIMSEASCCSQCNAYDCPMDNNEPIAQLLQIMIDEYGWYESETVTLTI